jgi:hypothetical protein
MAYAILLAHSSSVAVMDFEMAELVLYFADFVL